MKLALSALVIVLVAVNVDLRATWTQISGQSSWSILAAIAIIGLQIMIGGLRWHAVLMRIGGSMAAAQAVSTFYISVFFNALSGALGGDIARAWLANRTEARLKTVITSVIVDHVVAVAAIALLVLLTLPIFIERVGYGTALIPAAIAAAGMAGIALGAQLHRLPIAWQRHRLLQGLNELAGAMREVFLRPAAAVVVLGLAMLAQIALSLAAYVIARGLDMPVTLLDCVVLMQPVALATALPISIGGWGVREAAMVGLFGLIGLPSSSTLALSVQLGLLSLVATLPGGVLFLLLRGRTPAVQGSVAQAP